MRYVLKIAYDGTAYSEKEVAAFYAECDALTAKLK